MNNSRITFESEILAGKEDEQKYEKTLVMLGTKSKAGSFEGLLQRLYRAGVMRRVLVEE